VGALCRAAHLFDSQSSSMPSVIKFPTAFCS
jgi:hypothetical protein